MNKEKLEQMKKEKLEQMKELGRGGFSRGLSMLQKATANATATNTSTDSDANAALGSASSSGGDTESATLLSASAGGKPSYDDLVALSMKLTRQNKLMKAQFQKMQQRIASLQISDVDCRVLTAFVSDVVGVDVVACQRTPDAAAESADGEKSDDTAASTLDVKQLRERFEIMDALKTKSLKQQIAQLQMQVAATETNMSLSLLPMSPMAPPPPPPTTVTAGVPQYEEIDLLGDMFATPSTAASQQRSAPQPQQQQQPSAFSNDLLSFDFPSPTQTPAVVPPPTSAADSQAYTELEKQLNDTTEQLRHMEAELKTSAADNEALRKQWTEMNQQRTDQLEQLTTQKHEIEQRLTAAANDAHAQLVEAERRVAALQVQIEQLQTEQTQSNETLSPAAELSEIEALQTELKTVQALNEQLTLQVNSLQAAADQATASVRELEASVSSLKLENEQLAEKTVKETATTTDQPAANGHVSDAELSQLRERVCQLEALNHKLQSEAKGIANTNTSSANDVSALMEELERAKLGRAEADHAAKTLQDNLSASETKLTKSLNEAEQNTTIIEALRAEISHHAAAMQRVEAELSESLKTTEALKQEKNQLEETKDALDEQLQVLRLNNSSNLESVVGELAEAKKQVAEQREYMNGKIEVLIRDLDAARKQCAAVEATLAEKEKQHQKMVSSQSALTTEVMTLQKQVNAMEQDLQMAAEGLEAHASKAEESVLRRTETEEKLKNTRLQIETLKDQHLNDLEIMRSEKEAELERVRTERNHMHEKLQEVEAAYSNVSFKCTAVQEDLDHEKKRSNDLETRLGQLTAEIGNMSIDLAETKKALSDRMALATRLQTENMGFAEKQAEQAARVESALRDVATSKQLVADMEAKMRDATAEVQCFMAERDSAVAEMTTVKQDMDKEKDHMVREREAQQVKYNAALASEKETFRRELERVESDSKQKSKLAIHAVLEKEAEIERLSKRLASLEEDVRSGDSDNRKIFEFAQMQASRELEARANGAKIHELTRALEAATAHIQELQRDQSRHGEELTAMMQTQRREGVNMEYLKNVIVQFMSFKPGSSQQMRLVPVITTLLQFTASDMKEIKKATGRRSSWGNWGAEVPDYKPIAVATPSTDNTSARRRTSSPPSTTTSSSAAYDSNRSLPPRAASFTLPPHDEDADPSGTHSADF